MATVLSQLMAKDRYLSVGLMSGTSMDGVDAALVWIDADADAPRVELVEFAIVVYPDELKTALGEAAFGHALSAEALATLNTSVAVAFSGAAFEVCRRAGVEMESIDFIGSHGQTVAHAPPSGLGGSSPIAGTLQLGSPGMVAALTGVTTVGDFRTGDVALGGQGAPLAPVADWLLRRSTSTNRAVLNIGGIANVTWLPRGCRREDVVAFDTGPGNMVVDELFRVLFPGQGERDEGGQRAAAGHVSADLLAEMMKHPYFELAPPKSAGHREFGAAFAWRAQSIAEALRVSRDDTLATAAALTGMTIADACERYLAPQGPIDEMFVTGGGVHNHAIVAVLERRLEGTSIRRIDELGIPSDAKEAVDFALLARETLCGRPNVISHVTGASRSLPLGSVALGGVRR
jgi:anhydro-N-acetylmuramic acid kinase